MNCDFVLTSVLLVLVAENKAKMFLCNSQPKMSGFRGKTVFQRIIGIKIIQASFISVI